MKKINENISGGASLKRVAEEYPTAGIIILAVGAAVGFLIAFGIFGY